MTNLYLSGAGGSTNWLPLILPLFILLAVVYAVDYGIKLMRKRKLHRENALIDKLTTPTSEAPVAEHDEPEA